MDLQKRLQEIKEHFSSISLEEFKENLKLVGFGEIDSCKSENMELIPVQILVEEKCFYYCSSPTLVGLSEYLHYQLFELGDVA